MDILQGPSKKYFSSSASLGYGLKNRQGSNIVIRNHELPEPANSDIYYSPPFVYSEFRDNQIISTPKNIVFANILPKTSYYVFIKDTNTSIYASQPIIVLRWISGDQVIREQELTKVKYYIEPNGNRYYLTTIETEENAGFICLELSVKDGSSSPVATSNISLINSNIAGTSLFLNGNEEQPLFYQYYTQYKLSQNRKIVLKWGDKTTVPNYLYAAFASDITNAYWPTTIIIPRGINNPSYAKILGTSYLQNTTKETPIVVEYYDVDSILRIEALNFKPVYSVFLPTTIKRKTVWTMPFPEITDTLITEETAPKYAVFNNCYFVDENNNILTCIEKDLLSNIYNNITPTKLSDFVIQLPLQLDLGTYTNRNIPFLSFPKISDRDVVLAENIKNKGILVYNESKLIDNRNIAAVYESLNAVEYLFPIANFNIDNICFSAKSDSFPIETVNFSNNYIYGGSGSSVVFGLNGFKNYLGAGPTLEECSETSSGVYSLLVNTGGIVTTHASSGTHIAFVYPSGVVNIYFGTLLGGNTGSGNIINSSFAFDDTPIVVASGTKTLFYNTPPEKTLWYYTDDSYYSVVPDVIGQAPTSLTPINPTPISSCTTNTNSQAVFIESNIYGGGIPDTGITPISDDALKEQYANIDNYVSKLNFNKKIYQADATIVLSIPDTIVNTVASGYYLTGFSVETSQNKAQEKVLEVISKHMNIGTLAIVKFSSEQVEGFVTIEPPPPSNTSGGTK